MNAALYNECRSIMREAILSGASAGEGVRSVIDYAARHVPGPLWQPLAALDFDADAERLRDRVKDVLAADPPPPEALSLVFQLHHPGRVLPSGELHVTCDIMLTYFASEHPYEDCERGVAVNAWDTRADLRSQSTVTAAVYELLVDQQGEARDAADYLVPLCFASIAVAQSMGNLSDDALQTGPTRRAVEVAWQNGDWVSLGYVTERGFAAEVTYPPAAAD